MQYERRGDRRKTDSHRERPARRGEQTLPVPDEVRVIEKDIDAKVASMAHWKHGRAAVLEGLMGIYRDCIEFTFVKGLDARMFGTDIDVETAMVHEDRLRNGAFWAMKWAKEYCPDVGRIDPICEKELLDAILIGQSYDVLVDVLKYGELDLMTLSVNQESKEIICREGEDLTGFDTEIVEHQQAVGPTHVHTSLTTDSDRLTSRWCAGDYRRVARHLAEFAESQEGRIAVRLDVATTLDGGEISIPQPTLVWLDRPSDPPDAYVFDSLTMPSKMSEPFMWRARALLETPIANCADRFCALSSDLKAIACVDDYMLRLAAREDEKQYSRVSGLRESRMVDVCRTAFEGSNGEWTIRSPVTLADPPQEADIVASRSGEILVIELKSTLRPEALWEVYKRNEDILNGLCQAESLVRRGVGNRGLVITDGYRGDYSCWEEALRRDVTIGTLSELEELARDPDGAIRTMKSRAGVPTVEHGGRRLPDRNVDLFGWTLRLVDSAPD